MYLVYPTIDQSELQPQLKAASGDFESISSRFRDYRCGLLHGRMKSDEKEEALNQFRSGETPILLSTQVVEVGVDVPDASLMVVMNAERFGIAQLHQLRGRVGRGSKKSKCVFVPMAGSNSLSRLKILEESTDGFYLANADLLLRGPGDLIGKKQSGHLPHFPVARLEADGNILQEAHLAALVNLKKSRFRAFCRFALAACFFLDCLCRSRVVRCGDTCLNWFAYLQRILGASHDLERFPRLKMELSMRQPLSFLGD